MISGGNEPVGELAREECGRVIGFLTRTQLSTRRPGKVVVTVDLEDRSLKRLAVGPEAGPTGTFDRGPVRSAGK